MGGTLSGAFDPAIVAMVAESPLGTSLWVRLAGLVLVCAAALNHRAARGAAAVGAVLVCASFALRGHALNEPRLILGVLVTVHLMGLAFWTGAFAPLHRMARTEPINAGVVAAEFGAKAVWVVAALVVAGGALYVVLTGDPIGAIGTPFGRLLLVKLCLFAPLLGLAAYNKLRLTPSLGAGDARAGIAIAPVDTPRAPRGPRNLAHDRNAHHRRIAGSARVEAVARGQSRLGDRSLEGRPHRLAGRLPDRPAVLASRSMIGHSGRSSPAHRSTSCPSALRMLSSSASLRSSRARCWRHRKVCTQNYGKGPSRLGTTRESESRTHRSRRHPGGRRRHLRKTLSAPRTRRAHGSRPVRGSSLRHSARPPGDGHCASCSKPLTPSRAPSIHLVSLEERLDTLLGPLASSCSTSSAPSRTSSNGSSPSEPATASPRRENADERRAARLSTRRPFPPLRNSSMQGCRPLERHNNSASAGQWLTESAPGCARRFPRP